MRPFVLVAALVLMATAAAADGIVNFGNGTTGESTGINNASGGGSGPPANPLRIVATNGAVANILVAQAATPGRTQTISRIPIQFGCAATGVTFRFDNWYVTGTNPATGNPPGVTVDAVDSTGAGQPVTIVGLALEPGGTASSGTTNVLTPITFGGNNGITIPSGGSAQSDALPGPFATDSFYWIRVTATIPNPGGANNAIWLFGPAADPNFVGPNGAGDVAANYIYPPGQNIAQVYRAGPFTAPLNVAISRTQGFGPTATLGNCSGTNNRSVINIGASWSFGVDDPFASVAGAACTTNNTAIAPGLGAMAHAALSAGGTGAIPFVKIAVSGTGTPDAKNWMDGSATGRARAYLGFGNILFDDMGANDIGVLTPAQIETNNSNMWTLARSLGIQKVVVMEMTQRSSSTDNFVTLANQTPFPSFTLTGDANTVNCAYTNGANCTGGGSLTSQIDGVLTERFTRGASNPNTTNYWLWQVNGNAFSNTCAGLHPNATSYPVLGTELRGIINGLTVTP